MMILKWFDSTEAVAFGRQMATDLCVGLDRLSGKPRAPKKTDDRAARLLNSALMKVDFFRQQHRPNLYQKAKLLNTLKWELREAKLDDATIDQIVATIAPRL